MDAGDLPVSGSAVFPGRGRPHATPRANGIDPATETVEWLDVSKAEVLETRQRQATGLASQVAEGVAARITVFVGVRGLPDSDAVEDDDRSAFQRRASVYARSTRERRPVSSSYGDTPA